MAKALIVKIHNMLPENENLKHYTPRKQSKKKAHNFQYIIGKHKKSGKCGTKMKTLSHIPREIRDIWRRDEVFEVNNE